MAVPIEEAIAALSTFSLEVMMSIITVLNIRFIVGNSILFSKHVCG